MAAEPTSSADLVAAAMKAVGADTDLQFARLLWRDYGIEADQPKVSRWRRGLGSPNYEATIALLTITGRLAAPTKTGARAAAAGEQKPLLELMQEALRNQDETRADIRTLAVAVERIATLVEEDAREEGARVRPRRRRTG